jgi:His-Xaa-Ser system protein HxsD
MSAVVWFDARATSMDAIQRACYRCCDRLQVEVRRDGDEYRCEVWALDGTDPAPSDLASLRAEVTDHVLRERIRAQTEGTRNVLLALAFSRADLADESG